MKNLHKRIKRFREDKEICRKEMADLLGMTLNGYGKIERGEVEVSISRLYEIAGILGVRIADIAEITIAPKDDSDTLIKLNDSKKWNSDFDPFLYIEFLEARIEDLKAQLNHSQKS